MTNVLALLFPASKIYYFLALKPGRKAIWPSSLDGFQCEHNAERAGGDYCKIVPWQDELPCRSDTRR